MSDIRQSRKALLRRILEGAGKALPSDRLAAFDNSGSSGSLAMLIDKVARHAYQVTDADIHAVKASGLSEDQIFEIIVCAAVGEANRQYEAATAALEVAARGE
jgi:alkylhydroperoxidase family enzyme